MKFGEGVRPSYQPVVPDRSISWQHHEIPSLDAVVLNPVGADACDIELAIAVSKDPDAFMDYPLKSGAQGIVFFIGQKAVKISCPRYITSELTEADVMVNVGLSLGMKRTDGVHREFGVTVATPSIHAIVKPIDSETGNLPLTYIMDKVNGIENKWADRPHIMGPVDTAVYDAMVAVGFDETDYKIDFDGANVLIDRKPEDQSFHKLTVFDIQSR